MPPNHLFFTASLLPTKLTNFTVSSETDAHIRPHHS